MSSIEQIILMDLKMINYTSFAQPQYILLKARSFSKALFLHNYNKQLLNEFELRHVELLRQRFLLSDEAKG